MKEVFECEYAVLGGGIAGLSVAIGLEKLGWNFLVFESAREIRPLGAGLGLAANAMKSFRKLGVYEEVVAVGRELDRFIIRDLQGKKITSTNTSRLAQKHGISNFTIHRAALHEALLKKASPGRVLTAKRSSAVQKEETGYRVFFEDGSECLCRYVLVTEGLNSPIRKQLFPEVAMRYAGYTCWRGVADNSRLKIEETSETWAGARRFGIVPLAGEQIYWFACVTAPESDPGYGQFSIQDVRKLFSDFHPPVSEILEHTEEEALLHHDLYDLSPLPGYHRDGILLMGDAAHATTPNMGQGACMAIEDAAVFLDLAEQGREGLALLNEFEKRRQRKTQQVVKHSRLVGEVAHWQNPWAMFLRNTLLRILPDSINERQLESVSQVDFDYLRR